MDFSFWTTMMNQLAAWALNALSACGIPVLLLVAYAGSLGIPFPITLVIMAAGAFAREGVLDWRLALLACLLGASLADHSEYLLGRLAQNRLKRRFGERAVWKQADSTINKQGGWAILLTRFWLTPLAPAVNVIAGSRYPYLRFLLFDVAGELLWVVLYGGLGYLFAEQWERVSQTVSGISGLSVAAVALAAVVYFVVKRLRKKPRKPVLFFFPCSPAPRMERVPVLITEPVTNRFTSECIKDLRLK